MANPVNFPALAALRPGEASDAISAAMGARWRPPAPHDAGWVKAIAHTGGFVARLDASEVRAAADEMGCRDEVGALLARDPLDLVPARIPAVPKWADPRLVPQVLLADRQDALPPDATGALLRMIAMSQLDAPRGTRSRRFRARAFARATR